MNLQSTKVTFMQHGRYSVKTSINLLIPKIPGLTKFHEFFRITKLEEFSRSVGLCNEQMLAAIHIFNLLTILKYAFLTAHKHR